VNQKTLGFISAALVYGALAQGGFYRTQALTLMALTAITVFAGGPRQAWRDWSELPRTTRIGIAITAAAMTIAIAVRPIADSILSVAVHLTAVLAAVVGVRLGRRSEIAHILRLLSWTGVAVALLGLVGVAFHHEPLALEAQDNWRAASTLTYANSMAAFLVPCFAAALMRMRQVAPTASIEAAIIIGGFAATMSRGSAVGLAVGVVLVLATGGRRLLGTAGRSLLGGSIIGAAAAPSIFGTSRPILVAGGLALGLAVTAASGSLSRLSTTAVALALVAATAVVAAVFAPQTTSEIVDRAINEDRLQIWTATWETARDGPIFGQGLGHFEVYEVRYGEIFRIRYAHNEFLQALVETGWPGAIALAIGSILGAWGLWRRRSKDDEWFLAVLVVATFGVHGLTDFIWHVPVVGLATALWYGAAVGRRTDQRSEQNLVEPAV
jgi:hypothetical protein